MNLHSLLSQYLPVILKWTSVRNIAQCPPGASNGPNLLLLARRRTRILTPQLSRRYNFIHHAAILVAPLRFPPDNRDKAFMPCLLRVQ